MLDKRYIEHEVYRILKESFSDLTSVIFKHEFENRKRNPHARQYSDPKVANFAITLHYYSPKAYEYVRNVLCLPHPSTLREWASSINCNPGHLDNVYKHLSNRVLQHPLTSDCSLIIDEMSLKRETEWDSSCRQFSGFVDYGGGPVEGEIAQNALVLMLVGTRIHWKVPVGYAFTKHVNAENLQTLVKECIIKASNIGLSVLSVVADGSSVNLRAAVLLWCSFDVKTMRTWFPHPYRTSDKIYWICDASHMLKLMRNLLAEYEILARTTGESTEKIRWFYIQELHKLQMKDSLILANILSGRHVHYRNLIMKVNIAAQTMSSSVATALDFLRDDMKLPQFKGSEATCHFIRIIDRLFDTLNSKNPFAKGFKSPLRKENKMHWDPFLRYAKDYLLTLKRNDGCFIIDTRRKVPVVGFSITISSILELSNHLLSYPHYAYVLTYKFSQDHIEMLFSKIRRRGGWNNNPSSSQFRYALRTLLMTNSVKASLNANAVAQDDTADIHLQFGRNSNGDSRQALTAFESEESEEDSDMILSKMDSVFDLNGADWRRDVLYYIAGFVSRKLRKMITCPSCNLALFRQETEEPLSDVDSFLKRKDNGGLLTPSKGVFEVVLAAEKAFRSYVPASVAAEVLPSIKYLDLKIEHSVLKYINPCETFISLGEHFEDHEIGITEPHPVTLIRAVINCYLKLRLHKYGRLYKERRLLLNKSSIRQKCNKLVLFRGM